MYVCTEIHKIKYISIFETKQFFSIAFNIKIYKFYVGNHLLLNCLIFDGKAGPGIIIYTNKILILKCCYNCILLEKSYLI